MQVRRPACSGHAVPQTESWHTTVYWTQKLLMPRVMVTNVQLDREFGDVQASVHSHESAWPQGPAVETPQGSLHYMSPAGYDEYFVDDEMTQSS
jgi:hypothetical protein